MRIQIKDYKIIIDKNKKEAVIFYMEHLRKVRNGYQITDNTRSISADIDDPNNTLKEKLKGVSLVILVSIDKNENPTSFVEVNI